MAASLLRTGRLCFVKCLQTGIWSNPRGAPAAAAAAFSSKSKSGGSEKSSKKNTEMDPLKKAFLSAIREYNSKSKASGGLVDAGPEYQKALAKETKMLQKLFGGGDLESFPEFKFKEPTFKELK